MSRSSVLFMVSMLLITSQCRALGAKNATSEAVLDASTYPGSNLGSRVISAISALPRWGGTVDARQLQGPQVITETVHVPKGVTVLLGAAQIKSLVTPAFTVSHQARLLGAQGTNAYPGWIGPAGTVIWENNAGARPLIQVEPNGGAIKAEIAAMSLTNVVSLNSFQPNHTGTGLDLSHCVGCSIHDLELIGFNNNLYGSNGSKNNLYKLDSNNFLTAGYNLDTGFNSNTMVELTASAADGTSAVGYLLNGVDNTLMGGDCENYPNPGSYCIRMTRGGGNTVLGTVYTEALSGKFFEDDSHAVAPLGNTVLVNSKAWEVGGLPGSGQVGIPMTVAARVFNISSDDSLNATNIYTDPNPAEGSMFEIDWYIAKPGNAGSGTVTLNTLYFEGQTANPRSCTGMLSLAGMNTFNFGSCHVYAAGVGGFTVSASGGGGAGYTAVVAIRKIGKPE